MADCGLTYEDCVATPTPCFAHKMRYWREGSGVVGVARPCPERDWGGDTVRERAKDIMERGKANGYDPQPVGTRWV